MSGGHQASRASGSAAHNSASMDAGALEARLRAPLVPLKHVQPASTQPGYIPRRPASLPGNAPFGAKWHAKHGQWSCETLAFPAAYPRSIARSAASPQKQSRQQQQDSQGGPPARLSKEQIDAAVQDIVRNQRDARTTPPDLSRSNGPNTLWIAVNRYCPASKGKTVSSSKEPVTLVFAHANGFSKETWEATLADTIANWDADINGEIEDVFVLDMINQGDSAILNEDTLGSTFEWSDNGRDILQFILSYLPDGSDQSLPRTPSSPPSHATGKPFFFSSKPDPSLSHWAEERGSADKEPPPTPSVQCVRRVGGYITEDPSLSAPSKTPSSPSANTFRPRVLPYKPLPSCLQDMLALDLSKHSSRNSQGKSIAGQNIGRWRNRRIVLIGHSVGAAGMIYAASTFPQLFETLIAVDPTIFPKEFLREPFTLSLTSGAVIRRDRWNSKEEAKVLFQKNKGFFGKWNPDVLNGYVEFGLRDAPDGQGVTLKVDKMQEAYVFADTDNVGSKRAFHRLALLPPTLNVHIVRADVGNSTVPEEAYPQFEAIVKHATHTRIPGAGHLIVQEKPHELALEITGYLKTIEKGILGLKAKL